MTVHTAAVVLISGQREDGWTIGKAFQVISTTLDHFTEGNSITSPLSSEFKELHAATLQGQLDRKGSYGEVNGTERGGGRVAITTWTRWRSSSTGSFICSDSRTSLNGYVQNEITTV